MRRLAHIFYDSARGQDAASARIAVRDGGLASTPPEKADSNQNVILVPAFTGLGAPYWNADCRGAMFGLTRNSGPEEFARDTAETDH